jgi:uncharacterized membrane protein YphA (DoxX/SURF4 family)
VRFLAHGGGFSLQRLFSTFPGGRPGIGLLLVRAALGGLAVTFGVLYLLSRIEHAAAVWVIASVLILGGVALVIGFLTPFASLGIGLCVLGIAFSWFPGPPFAMLAAPLLVLLVAVTAVGIGLLGPGAFSIDGRLFGRREIVIPPRSPNS